MKSVIIKKKIIVIYHGGCTDGFSAAWAAWKKFGNRAEYRPFLHHETPDARLRGKTIYFLDIVYPETALRKIMRHNRVVILDHHVTMRDLVRSVPEHRYAVNHSGAVLSWQYFHAGKSVPRLLQYVEDGDLWRHVLPKSRAALAFLILHDFSFAAWSVLAKKFEHPKTFKECVRSGEDILRYEEKMVRDLVADGAEKVRFEGYEVYAINSPVLHSELGNILAEKKPPMAIIWRRQNRGWKVSLRSVGNFNVSKIAEKYGGGGHKNASGFFVPGNKPLPWQAKNKKADS